MSRGILRKLGCVVISRLFLAIQSEARSLKTVNAVCATTLDSSLRSAAFRMTGMGWLRSEGRERDNEETPGEKWGGIAGGEQEGSRVGVGAIQGGITGLSDSECNRGGCQSSRQSRSELCLSLQVCKAILGVMRRICRCGRRRHRKRCSCLALRGDHS